MTAPPLPRRIAASTWAHALLLALVGLTLYGQSLDGRFVWDANMIFVEDHSLGSMDNLLSGFSAPFLPASVDQGAIGQLAYYRPLLTALHVTERALFGTDPFWFKLPVCCYM